MTSPAVLTVGHGRARAQLLDDAVSLRTSTRAAYRLDAPLRVFFEAGALLMLTGGESDPVVGEPRSVGPTLAVPLTVGVSFRP